VKDLPPRTLGILLAFFGMLAISTDSLITRAADAEGWDVAFWYGVFTTPAMAAYLFVAEKGRPVEALRRSGRIVWVSGLLQMVSTTAFILAVKNTTIANVVVIIAAAPLVTAVLAWILLGERTKARTWVAIGLAMVGILIVVSGSLGGGGLTGDLLAVVAILSFGFNLVIWRRTIAASLWAWLFFAEVPPGTTLIGGAAILIGLLYGTVFAPTKEPEGAASQAA